MPKRFQSCPAASGDQLGNTMMFGDALKLLLYFRIRTIVKFSAMQIKI
jgi:hypothetical protein